MAINLLGNILQNGMNSPVSNGENINGAILSGNNNVKANLLNELNLAPGQIVVWNHLKLKQLICQILI